MSTDDERIEKLETPITTLPTQPAIDKEVAKWSVSEPVVLKTSSKEEEVSHNTSIKEQKYKKYNRELGLKRVAYLRTGHPICLTRTGTDYPLISRRIGGKHTNMCRPIRAWQLASTVNIYLLQMSKCSLIFKSIGK